LLLAFRRLPPRATVALLFALVIAVAGVTAALLVFHLWLPPASALVGLAIVYPLWGWRRLAGVSAYMVDELERLNAEPELLPHGPELPASTDIVGRQSSLLRDAIGRMQDMRRFVTDRLRQMPDATVVTDREGRIVLMNPEAEDLFDSQNVVSGDGIGPLLEMLEGTDRSAGAAQEPGATGVAFPPEGPGEMAREVRSADGRTFDLRIVPQQGRDGAPVGWIVRIIDISEVRAAERQREEVLRLLTHDMRSPQTSIIAALDTAGPDAIGDDLSRRIRGHALRTLGLADGFVQLARAESLAYEMEEVDLADAVIDAADDLWPQSSARRMTVDVGGVADGVIVMGERSLLTRALVNLIGNAIKYGVERGTIRCRLTREGRMAVCSVEDNGVGIAPEHVERLFEQFRRVPGGAEKRVDGAGLGLAFVHTVAVRHGGTIRCASVPGEGTVFTLTLPLADEADGDREPPADRS
jgi:signal transduction histidine kinase